MTEQGKEAGLMGFELAKKIKLLPYSFATKGLFTNTMKLKRFEARTYFKAEIEELYA